MTPLRPAKTQRDLLVRLGIGHFNATQIINYMMTQPATTDPKSPPIMLMVREIQKNLFAMGAPIDNTGYLDEPTTACITFLFGGDSSWPGRTWSQVVSAVVTARQNNVRFPSAEARPPVDFGPQATGGFGDSLFGEPMGTVLKWGSAIAIAALIYKNVKKHLS